jgi:catecholate siderophore receptor
VDVAPAAPAASNAPASSTTPASPVASTAVAASPATSATPTLAPVPVRARAETDRDSVRAATTRVGKGQQELRDIPQSVTVVTERLIDDRGLDDFKDVMRQISGVTFLAGETGEEDIRLRSFSLAQAGDIYADSLRDVAMIERDPFNNDRIEVLKGSASMLFGRGSTGGIVNQVNKLPFGMTQNEVSLTLGSGNERRLTGDFNLRTGEDAALRINALVHRADHHGAEVSKQGIAPSYRWGIGTADEFAASLYVMAYDNVPNYNHPWFIVDGRLKTTLPAGNYYGLASDYLKGSAAYGTLSHVHRFGGGGELRTTLRHGRYERDLWASVVRFGTTDGEPTTIDNLGQVTLLNRTPKGRVGISDITQLQSDWNGRVVWGGLRHELLAGVDVLHEDAKRNNNFAGAASGLVTSVGTPNDGASRADLRGDPLFNRFDARSIGVYAQDMVALNDEFKLLGGLRLDHFKASYTTQTTTAANGTVTPGYGFERSDSLWSPRVGALFQPDDDSSYYLSFGTSYNTSGDTYQFSPAAPNQRVANTAPEKSRNFEIGGKWELLANRVSLAAALFRSEKINERNTDPDTAAGQELLSGKRHASGLEANLAGRITVAWETWINYTWIPEAKIDRSNVALNATGTGAQVQGDRPGLTPRHSASLWTSYRLTPAWRVGGGINYRGEQNPEGARHVTVDSFATLDLMAEYTLREGTTLQLNVRNATDELYADMLYRGFYTPGAARSTQLSLKTRF